MNRPADVLHEDDEMLVVAKASGVLSTPDRHDPSLPHLRRLLEPRFGRLFLVHRLDRDTSGIMILARSEGAHAALSGLFEHRRVRKVYHALCIGVPDWTETVADFPLRTGVGRRARTVVDPRRGKASTTRLRLLEDLGRYALVEARPETGRTHQIRAHLMAVGYPVAADPLYGGQGPVRLSALKRNYRPGRREERPLIERSALHAFSLDFEYPEGQTRRFEAPHARDFRACLNQLRKLAAGQTTQHRPAP